MCWSSRLYWYHDLNYIYTTIYLKDIYEDGSKVAPFSKHLDSLEEFKTLSGELPFCLCPFPFPLSLSLSFYVPACTSTWAQTDTLIVYGLNIAA